MSEEVSRGTPDDPFVGKGTVKFWKREKGWGAVYVPDFAYEGDVFVYCSALWGAGLRELQQGQEVTISFYRQKQDSFNLVAATVQPA